MAQRAKTFHLRPVIVAFGTAALLSALVVALRPWEEQLLAGRLHSELATLSDEAAGDAVRRLAVLGDSAIPVLVEAIGSERASVAEAARSVLFDRIDHWELLPARQSSPKLAVLARSLADEVDQFGPSSRGLAADLAERILLWPTDTHAIDRTELIGNCATVLRRALPERRRAESARVAAVERSFLASADSDRSAQFALPQKPGVAIESEGLAMAKLPGGGLPIEPVGVPALPPRDLNAGQSNGGARATSPIARDASDPPMPPDRLPASSSIRPIPQRRSGGLSGVSLSPDKTQEPHVARQFLGGELGNELPNLATIDVMRLLHNTDASLAEAAEAELAHRGFSNVEVELGRRLTDADPAVRHALVDALPRIARLNAKPWLLWLSDDPVAEVRRAALTLMATSNDRDLLRRVEDLARRDADPRIAELADRLLKGRREALRR